MLTSSSIEKNIKDTFNLKNIPKVNDAEASLKDAPLGAYSISFGDNSNVDYDLIGNYTVYAFKYKEAPGKVVEENFIIKEDGAVYSLEGKKLYENLTELKEILDQTQNEIKTEHEKKLREIKAEHEKMLDDSFLQLTINLETTNAVGARKKESHNLFDNRLLQKAVNNVYSGSVEDFNFLNELHVLRQKQKQGKITEDALKKELKNLASKYVGKLEINDAERDKINNKLESLELEDFRAVAIELITKIKDDIQGFQGSPQDEAYRKLSGKIMSEIDSRISFNERQKIRKDLLNSGLTDAQIKEFQRYQNKVNLKADLNVARIHSANSSSSDAGFSTAINNYANDKASAKVNPLLRRDIDFLLDLEEFNLENKKVISGKGLVVLHSEAMAKKIYDKYVNSKPPLVKPLFNKLPKDKEPRQLKYLDFENMKKIVEQRVTKTLNSESFINSDQFKNFRKNDEFVNDVTDLLINRMTAKEKQDAIKAIETSSTKQEKDIDSLVRAEKIKYALDNKHNEFNPETVKKEIVKKLKTEIAVKKNKIESMPTISEEERQHGLKVIHENYLQDKAPKKIIFPNDDAVQRNQERNFVTTKKGGLFSKDSAQYNADAFLETVAEINPKGYNRKSLKDEIQAEILKAKADKASEKENKASPLPLSAFDSHKGKHTAAMNAEINTPPAATQTHVVSSTPPVPPKGPSRPQ